MKEITLEEAIKHYEGEETEQRELYSLCPLSCNGMKDCLCLEHGEGRGCVRLAHNYKQLAEWLRELQEAKELLKSAIAEWRIVCEWGNCGEYCGWYVNGKCTQEWSKKHEAEKLIGEKI